MDAEREKTEQDLRELLRVLQTDPRNEKAYFEIYEKGKIFIIGNLTYWLKGYDEIRQRMDVVTLKEDLTQETFIQIFNRIPAYDESINPYPSYWMIGFARNIFKKFLKKFYKGESFLRKETEYYFKDKSSFELKHIIEDRNMKELFLSLIERILSFRERIIVLIQLDLPTGESEYDEQFKHIAHFTYDRMASILNEIEGKRSPDWKPLTGEQVRAKYNYAIHKIYTYLEGTDLFDGYG